MTRAVLPSLTKFTFGGVSGEYLDDLMARIHLPQLDHVHLQFFHHPTFDVPKLPQIVHRIETFEPPFQAIVYFYDDSTDISFYRKFGCISLELQCTGLDNQLSWLNKICPQLVPFLSQTNFLELDHDAQDDQDSTLLLEFLRPFSAVKTLLIYRETH